MPQAQDLGVNPALLGLLAFLLSVVFLSLFILLATWLVTREPDIDAALYARVFLTSLATVFLVSVLQARAPLGDLVLLFDFLVLLLLLRFLVIPEVSVGDEWLEALLVAVIALILLVVFLWVLRVFNEDLVLLRGLV